MERPISIWTVGPLAVIFSIASTCLNVVFALTIGNIPVLSALRVLLFVALTIKLVVIAVLAYFLTLYGKNFNSHSVGLRASTWQWIICGAVVAATSLVVSGVTFIWLAVRQSHLPNEILHQSSTTLLRVWFVIWGIFSILHTILYFLLGLWAKRVLETQSAGRLNQEHDIRRPPMDEGKTPSIRDEKRTKPVKGSSPSSAECSVFLAAQTETTDSAFDHWDISYEMRAILRSSPLVTRFGLEPILGSRLASPTDAMDGPSPLDSPISSSPYAPSYDTGTAFGLSLASNPPSTSRPTSPSYAKSLPLGLDNFKSSMQDLIRPPFRPNSPRPPPIAVAGTMVIASPIAEQTITPRTLANLRSCTILRHWKAIPGIGESETQGNKTTLPGSPPLGSPGPSIIDDDNPPSSLPRFILAAGLRQPSWI